MDKLVVLPNYNNPAYLTGDYSEFKYNTELNKKGARICFLSTRKREVPDGSKLESLVKRDNNPNVGPGYYTEHLLPKFNLHKKRVSKAKSSISRNQIDSLEELFGFGESETSTLQALINSANLNAKKKVNKSGLLWGKRSEMFTAKGLGPADTNIERYPENLKTKRNKAAFNSSTFYKQPLTITTVAPVNNSFNPITLFKSSFDGKKELNLPKIICVKFAKDKCSNCKSEIEENYFFIKNSTFLCQKCYAKNMKSKSWRTRIKLSMFELARYCTRFHVHHHSKGYEKLMPDNKVYKQLFLERYHQQYKGSGVVDKGVPSKHESKAGAERSQVYQSLFSDSTLNNQQLCSDHQHHKLSEQMEKFDYTIGSVRVFEDCRGVREERRICDTPPFFVFPQLSHLNVFSMA